MDSEGPSRDEDRRADEWLAGTATANITPEASMWMAGFGARDRPSEGIHRDLHAKVLALEDCEGARTAIVSVEILFIGRQLRAAVERRCAERYDLAPKRLLLNATHTHQGPVTRSAYDDVDGSDGDIRRVPKAPESPHFIPIEYYGVDERYRERTLEYREYLEDRLVDLVGEAFDGQSAAELRYGHGRCGSAMSRRQPYEDGVAFRPYSDGSVDHEVPVLAVEDPAGEGDEAIRALLFGYACHTTVQFIYEFSGDWAGYTQEFLEDRYPNATAIFLQGCGGDQKAYPERESRYTEGHARAVALGVEAALESVCRPVRGPLRAAYEETTIEFEGPPSRDEIEAMARSDDHGERWRGKYLRSVLDEYGEIPTEYPYPVQTLGFSTDLTLVALAGEVLVDYSLRLKDELDGPVWVGGYSNDAFTYVPTRQAIAEGGYEGEAVVGNTTLPGKWKPDIEDRIVSHVHALVDRVQTPSSR